MTALPDRPFAVVTGASTGIGLEIARELAERGYDLLVCAEEPMIGVAADGLRGEGRAVIDLVVDLATPDGVGTLVQQVLRTGRPVDVLALNAGVGIGGAFVESDLEQQLRLVRLDVESVVHLAHRLVPRMVERGAGRVLVTASVAATMPGPWNATYAAAKAFDHSFALALREELKGTGVSVTSLQPGPTDTEFFERAGMEDTQVGQGHKTDPAVVARAGVQALLDGEDHVVVGPKGRLQTAISRVLPDAARAKVHGTMAKPRDQDRPRP